MLRRTLLLCAAALAATPATAAESDYALSCRREVVNADRAKTRPAAHPLNARIHFTGTTSSRRGQDGTAVLYEDLVISIGGSQFRGGYVSGSTYDASTVYDEAFRRTGYGKTTWAFSRGFGAFTLNHEGRHYVCDLLR